MAKKITLKEFMYRLNKRHPNATIILLNYTAISNPLTIKCQQCGKEQTVKRARDFLGRAKICCEVGENRVEKLLRLLKGNEEFLFVKKIDKDNVILHHKKCGNDLPRKLQAALDNPTSCTYCETIKTSNMLSKEEAQQQIDRYFNSPIIQLIEYNGQLKKCKYRCLECGMIFVQQHTCLLQSRGCPRCHRFKSRGESFLANLLREKNINFKEQVKFEDLSPFMAYDFGVYDEKDNLSYLIEVQGEHHFIDKSGVFRDPLKVIQERDKRKEDFCHQNNIPLYKLIYLKGVFRNIDILPFK